MLIYYSGIYNAMHTGEKREGRRESVTYICRSGKEQMLVSEVVEVEGLQITCMYYETLC